MSGHSHAKTVKATKDANAAVRGKIFSKMARLISLAAKEGGNLDFNSKLKQSVEVARKFNMPKENIERAIKRGTGELEGEKLEPIVVEILGPGGINIIVEGITDNKNRSLGEIKQISQKRNAKLANEGSVKWQFDQVGIISTPAIPESRKEEGEMLAIEAGASDIKWQTDDGQSYLEIITKPEELAVVKKSLEEKGFKIESVSLGWSAKEEIEAHGNDKETLEKLFEDLDENDSVQNIYSNLKN
ncbi:MAG: YebC/PmpR family DNA-binding transcriptional regulator [Candidatus Pacebacteria bacterium]|nr:YebC/PmpR family DNA-binding transcriptional regulator [Candidatus Paceibacterota bacterium]